MKARKKLSLLLVALTLVALTLATSAMAQTKAAPKRQALDPLGILRPRSRPATSTSVKTPVRDAVALGLASAKVYHFSSADYPGSDLSVVFDMNSTGTAVGDYSFTAVSPTTGFTFHAGNYQSFTVPGSAPGSMLTGINTSGAIVGSYADTSNLNHGFLDVGGVFTNIDEPGASLTQPYGINDNGEIVGQYIDSSQVSHGFSTIDSGATFSNFDYPGAISTIAAGVNTAGVIVGQWGDGSTDHGFILSGGVYNSIDFPLATSTTAIGINDSNEVAGYYTDATNNFHGFLYLNGNFFRVDVAGAMGTELSRIKNKGQITGVYFDDTNESHGMTGK